MSSTHIPKALRAQVAAQARYRCGYCLTAEAVVGTPMELDHIIPEALGGLTEEDNLWLACSLCNDHKGTGLSDSIPLPERSCGCSIHAGRSGTSIFGGPRQAIRSLA